MVGGVADGRVMMSALEGVISGLTGGPALDCS